MEEKKYGLVTAITMVVGIVIGSGIFFKADDILVKSDGNILVGALALAIGAFGIIFGGLTIAQIAQREDGVGGIIAYSEKAYGKKVGYYVGMTQIVLYYPCLIAIVAWVAGTYTSILFNFEINGLFHWGISLFYICFVFTVNLVAKKLGGIMQNITTFIKMVPLILIAVLGITYGSDNISSLQLGGSGVLSTVGVLVTVAFAYDGWILTTSICHEVKNAKRNIPLALMIGPIVVLVIYMLYYLGISLALGADQIMALGDGHVAALANKLLGAGSYKYIVVCIIISVLGAMNGLTLGMIRLPYSLGVRKEVIKSDWLAKVNKKTGMPVNAGILSFLIVLFWFVFHFLTTKISYISTFDISALPIIINYIIYITLYIYVYRFQRDKGIGGFIKKYVIPTFAILGALVVVYGGFTDKNIVLYSFVTILSLIIVFFFKNKDLSDN